MVLEAVHLCPNLQQEADQSNSVLNPKTEIQSVRQKNKKERLVNYELGYIVSNHPDICHALLRLSASWEFLRRIGRPCQQPSCYRKAHTNLQRLLAVKTLLEQVVDVDL